MKVPKLRAQPGDLELVFEMSSSIYSDQLQCINNSLQNMRGSCIAEEMHKRVSL